MSLNEDGCLGMKITEQIELLESYLINFYGVLDFYCPEKMSSPPSIIELKKLCCFVSRRRNTLDHMKDNPTLYEQLFNAAFHKLPFEEQRKFVVRDLPRDFEMLNGFLYELILERTFAEM